MTRSKLLTIEDLIGELDMGKATLKFILHRFSPWLATQMVNDETYYTEQAVTTLSKIRRFLDTGMLPEQIEASLAQEAAMLKATANLQHPAGNQGTIPVDIESASMFKDMLQIFIEKQDRIALAQEALSRVEERKADAMEKRAAAEEKKADAMTNIALALQEMSQRHSDVPQVMELAGRAVETLALEESPGLDESLLDTNFDKNKHLFEDPAPMEKPFKDQDHEDLGDIRSPDMDDLSLLVNETDLTLEDTDDLSSLVDSVSDPYSDLDPLESLLEETPSAPETNNLSNDMVDMSKLVDSDLSSSNSLDNEDDLDDLFSLVGMDTDGPRAFHKNLDDLSRLIEPASDEHTGDLDDLFALLGKPAQSQEAMDDLSRLIEPANDEHTGDLDDLSALLGKPAQSQEAMDDLSRLIEPANDEHTGDLDDLSALTGKSTQSQEPMDDLSRLIIESASDENTGNLDDLSALAGKSAQSQEPIDDLSRLVGDTGGKSGQVSPEVDTQLKETPSIKPDILPDQDRGKYKAAVMKIIIELKGQGLTAQQTTDRLNHDDVTTLSGKPAWGLKAIDKIYGFIDSTK